MDNVTSGSKQGAALQSNPTNPSPSSAQTGLGTATQSGMSVNNGDTLDIAAGVSSSNVTVNAGGVVTVSGGTLTTATVSGGEVDVFSGGTVSAANVTNGGNLYVEDGASAVSASVGSAGYLEVDAGGVA
ncbi:hypothetical protein AD949_04140, partial [Acetobacter orleanensis]